MSNEQALPGQKPRSLASRITRIYVFWVLAAYFIATGGLWWFAHYVAEKSLEKQAISLIPEFDEMGTPVYLTNSASALERIRQQAAKNPDLLFVRYHEAPSRKVLGEYTKSETLLPDLTKEQVAQLGRPGNDDHLVLTTHTLGLVTAVSVLAPIRTHSMQTDFSLDMGLDDKRTEVSKTIGYLVLGMDLRPSREIMLRGLAITMAFLTAILVLSFGVGRRQFRRALTPLLDLQAPLKQLAAGDFTVSVNRDVPDLEIRAVSEALNATIVALRLRDAEKEEAVRAKLEAEVASEAKGRFLAHMSHEVRTPLNGVLGFLRLLSQTELNSTQLDYLRTTEVSAKTLLTVINDILDFSKIDAGKVSIERLDTDLRELCEEVMSLHAAAAEEKGLDLVLVFGQGTPTRLMADPSRITQILSNLVGNAIKFTEHGEVLVEVDAVAETDTEATLRFRVSDTGIGITKEARDRLFHPFSQADASTTRKYGGTGLGLVISKKLIELMGGQIEVDSRIGHGTQFVFTVKLDKLGDGSVCMPLPDIMAKLRILAATPNPRIAAGLAENLAAWGIAHRTVGSGKTALALLRDQTFDAVILDHAVKDMMPKEFTEAIQRVPRLQDTPVLLLGNLSTCLRTQEVRQEGFCSCISKPAKSSELYNELSRLFVCSQRVSTPKENRQSRLEPLPDGRKIRILIVDDNDINRKLAQILVQTLGGDADLAEDGKKAVAACVAQRYDAILMDIHMPVMDGIEATARIRELEAGRARTPIIALTANALSGDRERYIEAGMDDYLSKPLKEDALIGTLSKWLYQSETGIETPITAPSPLPAQAPADMPVVDPAHGIESSFGDHETWHTVLTMLFDQLPEYVDRLNAAQAAHDTQEIRAASHKLAGASSYCGTPAVHHAAKQVELLCDAGDQDGLDKALPVLLQQIERLLRVKESGVPAADSAPMY